MRSISNNDSEFTKISTKIEAIDQWGTKENKYHLVQQQIAHFFYCFILVKLAKQIVDVCIYLAFTKGFIFYYYYYYFYITIKFVNI